MGNGTGSVVSFLDGEGPGAILDGFTISGGGGTPHDGAEYGGGIVGRQASPIIRNNVITHNEASIGAGAAFGKGSPRIENNVITANTGRELGGSDEIVGAGLAFLRGSPTVVGNHITNNLMFDAGGRRGFGSGIFGSKVLGACFDGNEIIGNLRDPRFDVDGGGICLLGPGSASIAGNCIEANESCNGGGVSSSSVDVVFVGNVIRNNVARCDQDTTGFGGGVAVFGGMVEIRNALVAENESSFAGGGISFNSAEGSIVNSTIIANRAIEGAGVSSALGVGPQITNCTIIRQQLLDSEDAEGSGVAMDRNATALTNCIVRENVDAAGLDADLAGDPIVTHSNVAGGYPGQGNIDLPSLLEVTSDGWVHLQNGSPEIDAGSNSAPDLPLTDEDGDDRILDGDGDGDARVDMGSDELRREVAVRYGTVTEADSTDTSNVLLINGTAGDHERIVSAASSDILLDIVLPPTGGDGRFVVHANSGAPEVGTRRVLPRGLGTIGFPLLLPEATPSSVWNNLGKESALGESRVFGMPISDPPPAPTVLLDTSGGGIFSLPPGTILTFQGVIIDPASEADVPASITNAVVLAVE